MMTGDERQQTLFEMPRVATTPPKAPPTSRQVGRVIARRRLEAGMNQGALARIVGLSQDTLSRVELGKYVRGIPLDYIEAIARALKSSVAAILGEATEDE
jgi:transcriptional regulator with XRE-family HTH domain